MHASDGAAAEYRAPCSVQPARTTGGRRTTRSSGYVRAAALVFVPWTDHGDPVQFDPIEREGIEAPTSSQNKDGQYQCKKHGSPCTCSSCRVSKTWYSPHRRRICSLQPVLRLEEADQPCARGREEGRQEVVVISWRQCCTCAGSENGKNENQVLSGGTRTVV